VKVLNLYAGIGGNRKYWKDVDVTAVEIKPEIAKIYKDFFPSDNVVIDDAHQYLLNHYAEYDFIWSSPPCPSHSRIRNVAGVGAGHTKPMFPDMKLYEEIIFLQQVYNSSGTSFNGKYCVENVRSYYEPLIAPQERGMHYFWANFHIANYKIKTRGHFESKENLQKIKGFKVDNMLALKNCVEPELGLHIFNCAFDKFISIPGYYKQEALDLENSKWK